MLIVLEGLDGAGKSTQVKKLKEYLQGRCGALEYIHFPRYDAPVYGELISRFLRGEDVPCRDLGDDLRCLFFRQVSVHAGIHDAKRQGVDPDTGGSSPERRCPC